MGRDWRGHAVALVALGCGSAWLYFWGRDLHRFTQWLAAYIGLYVAQLAIYALASWLIWRRPAGTGKRTSLRIAFAVCLFAMAFRLEIVSQRPFLSADVYRYAWDGRVQAAGINPYRYSPDAPEVVSLRDDNVFAAIPEEDRRWTSPYAPVAQAVYYVAYIIRPSSVAALKLVMSLFDLIAMLALIGALARTGQDPARVVVFAWHPLLIYESAHSGHVESVYIAFIALALAAWCYRKRALNGALLAAATLVKFYPALLLPAFLGGGAVERQDRSSFWRSLFNRGTAATVTGFGVAACLLWLPYSSATLQLLRSLRSYFAEEGFAGSGSRYFMLELLRSIVPFPTSLFLAIAAAALVYTAARVAVRAKSRIADVASGCLSLVGLYLLLTSPRYAWYYVWLLPFLCFSPRLAWLYLASASALLYLVWYTPMVYPNIPLLLGCGVYLPAIGLLALGRLKRAPARRTPSSDASTLALPSCAED